jgi:RecA-family ATPase
MNVMYDENVDYTRRLTQAYTHVNEVVRDEEIDLVIIDNASDVYGANEIHRASVRDFITSLKRLTAHRPDSAVLLLGHASRAAAHAQKKGALYSGSTAWHNSVRSRWELSVENIEDDEPAGDRRRILRCAKSNYGPEGHSYGWYWNPEHQVLLPEEPKSPTENRILRDREDKLLLRALMAVIDGGGRVTVNTTGNNNVRKALEAAEPDLAKRKTADVDLALRRLMLVKPRLVETIELKGRNGTLYEYWAVTDAGRLHASS